MSFDETSLDNEILVFSSLLQMKSFSQYYKTLPVVIDTPWAYTNSRC